jgi:LuxR family maltose regulon positive regulatory protein
VIWSRDAGRYEWYHQNESDSHPLDLEDEAAFIRLIDSSSFSFQGKHGHLTLRKESRLHGQGYWYAYHTRNHRTLKHYVGRSASLSLARLEEIAQVLTDSGSVSTDEPSQLSTKTTLEPEFAPAEEREAQDHVPVLLASPPSEQFMAVLSSKLHFPRLHTSLLARSHLLAQLDSSLQGKLTLLSAPAGFGKTTMVSQWVAHLRQRHEHLPVAWLSLDPGDNDPMRFWRYVLTACQAFRAGRDQSAFSPSNSGARSAASHLDLLLTTFLNELASLPHRSILVLEDYHVISEPEIHASLSFVLEHLPITLHLVVISRMDPPLPLARLRAHGELCELHAEDLRFSEEETASFLQQALPIALSTGEIHRLDMRLEGWVTGLRLVTLALQRRLSRSEAEHFLMTFSGSHRHLLDFFVTEVLDAQPEPLQRFLLSTSVLSRLSGPLCDAVTESAESEQILKVAAQANLFLQSLDGSGQWYRSHPLFAEAMRAEARLRFGEEELRACYSRASEWYEQEGMLPEAVEMALSAQEFARVAVLIEQSIRPHYAYKIHEYYTLRRWLDSLPEDILEQHPRLCLNVAIHLLFSWRGRPDCSPATLAHIERLLQRAECAWQAQGNQGGLGEILAFRALISREQDDLTLAARFAREALARLPVRENLWRGSCFASIGAQALRSGRLNEARETLLEARVLLEAAGNIYAVSAVLLLLAETCWRQGVLRQAAELYRMVSATPDKDLSDTGNALLGLARLSYEGNELEQAWQQAQEALDLGAEILDDTLRVQASLVLAAIEQTRGQPTQTQQRLHTLLARLPAASTRPPLLLQRRIEAFAARLALAVGDLAAAERWSITSAAHRESLPLLDQEQEDLVAIRLLLARGQAEDAFPRLERLRVEAHQQSRTRSEVEILLLMARACFATTSRSRALPLLREALGLAQPEGYLRLFLDEGEEMVALLHVVLPTIRMGRYATYVERLLHAIAAQRLEREASSGFSSPASARLSESLSPQEQRVLRLLAAGFSNQEIADALIVSINTVKTQVRSIYQKLHVKSRKEIRSVVHSPHPF